MIICQTSKAIKATLLFPWLDGIELVNNFLSLTILMFIYYPSNLFKLNHYLISNLYTSQNSFQKKTENYFTRV